jgi:histidinol-phosphate/aromatic aminotransferase/cobyric acid decarboxylase-like protein
MLNELGVIRISPQELALMEILERLSSNSGSHSPSLATMQQALPEVHIDIDACFLSNPLATDLFWANFNSDVLDDPQLFKRMLEAYPSQNRVIAEQLSSTIGVDPGRVFIANGATEAIQAVIHNYASHIHINIPTFSPYYEFAGPEHRVTKFQLDSENDFALDPEKYVESVLRSGADTAVLISPNNPDGYLIPTDDLRWILSRLTSLRTVIVDESFIHFADRSETNLGTADNYLPTFVGLTDQFDNVTVIKSMSKDFGIAGIRAGYAIMKKSRVNRLLDHGYLWNTSGIAEYFFSLFTRPTFLSEYRGVLDDYRVFISRFTSMTSGANFIRTYPTNSNFQLMQMPAGISASVVTTLLLVRHGVYVRACGDKIGLDGEFIRVAIRTEAENELVFDALKDVLG